VSNDFLKKIKKSFVKTIDIDTIIKYNIDKDKKGVVEMEKRYQEYVASFGKPIEELQDAVDGKEVKKMNIFNGESRAITVVTDYGEVIIPPHESRIVEVDEDAQFSQETFYVEEEGSWYIKTESCHTGCDAEVYDAATR
jgi:hypothetical protein